MRFNFLILFFILSLVCMPYNLHAEDINNSIPVTSTIEKSADTTKNTLVEVQKITIENSVIKILTDRKLSSFSTFKLAKPARLVIDLPNVTNKLSDMVYSSQTPPVSSIKVVSYTDKLRLIIEAADSQLFPEAEIDSNLTGLVINLVEKNKVITLSSLMTNTRLNQDEPTRSNFRTSGAITSNGYVESVSVDYKPDTTRISVKFSGNCSISDPHLLLNGISASFGDCIVPLNWQGAIKVMKDHPAIKTITLFPASATKKVEAGMLIETRKKIKFSFSKDNHLLVVDVERPLIPEPTVHSENASQKMATGAMKLAAVAKEGNTNIKKFNGKPISMDFVDNVELRQIFTLLANETGENFIIGDDVKGNYTIKLNKVPWDQAVDLIARNNNLVVLHQGNVIEIITKAKQIERDKLEDDEQQKESKRILDKEKSKEEVAKTIDLQTEIFIVNYSDVAGIAAQFTGLKSARGTVTPDSRTSSVIVKDVPQALNDMRKLLTMLDRPEKQVMIEARIVEASYAFTQSLGINWGTKYLDGSASVAGINSISSTFGGQVSGTASAANASGGTMLGIAFGKIASNISLDMRLNAAAGSNLIKVLSSPKVATINHKTAKISQGQQIPYQNTTATTGAVTAFVAATLSLEVTPHINANGTIIMKIDAKNDSPGTGSPPAINTKQATTELLLKDGETSVIGGIFTDNAKEEGYGVPFLMDIPFLGNLFKSKTVNNDKSELLIFITPRIMNEI